jgi:hypothetical protein
MSQNIISSGIITLRYDDKRNKGYTITYQPVKGCHANEVLVYEGSDKASAGMAFFCLCNDGTFADSERS